MESLRLGSGGSAALRGPGDGAGEGIEAAPERQLPSCRWRTVVHRSIAAVAAASWDALVGPAAVVRSHAYLTAIEGAGLDDCRYFYPVVYDETGAIMAHACVYTVTTDLAQLLPRGCGRPVSAIRHLWPRFLCFRITECGAPMVAAHAITLRADQPRESLLKAIEAAVASIARDEKSALVVFRDFTDDEGATFSCLLELGYNRVFNLPLARMRIRWDSYEEYLASMRSRYRKDIRRRLDRARADGQTVRYLTAFGDDAAMWASQARGVHESSKGFKREVPSPAYYANIDRELGSRSLLLVIEKDGRELAHGMVLLDEANAMATCFGREPGPPSAEWFHLLNEVITLGIERGCRYVNLGRGSYDAKSLAGADIESLHVYCKCRYWFVNPLIKRVPNVMQQPTRGRRRIFHDV